MSSTVQTKHCNVSRNVPSCGSALNVYKESDNRAMWNKLRTNHNIDVPETWSCKFYERLWGRVQLHVSQPKRCNKRSLFRSLISCLFLWRGVNRRQEVSRHHHDLKERGRTWYARLPNKGAAAYRASRNRFSAISLHDYLHYCGKLLAHFLMKIDRNIISSLQYSLLTLRASWLVWFLYRFYQRNKSRWRE